MRRSSIARSLYLPVATADCTSDHKHRIYVSTQLATTLCSARLSIPEVFVLLPQRPQHAVRRPVRAARLAGVIHDFAEEEVEQDLELGGERPRARRPRPARLLDLEEVGHRGGGAVIPCASVKRA